MLIKEEKMKTRDTFFSKPSFSRQLPYGFLKSLSLLFVGGVTLCGAGCYIERDTDVTPPHKTSVKRTTFSIHVPFGTHHPTLNSREREQLKSFIQRSRPGPVYGRLVVRKLNARFGDHLTDSRVKHVISFLTQSGISIHRIEVSEEGAGGYTKTETETGMWIGIEHYLSLPPRCPGFDGQVMDKKVPPEGENNFGCSNEYNFSQMVSEPKHIYKGDSVGASDPVVQSRAIEAYRRGKTKKLKIEKAASSAGADSGSEGGSDTKSTSGTSGE